MSQSTPDPETETSAAAWRGGRQSLVALLGLAFLIGLYFSLRSGGRWAESDSGSIALAIRAVIDHHDLAPDAPRVYGNGYGYQVVSAAILAFTGLDVPTLQQVIYPLVSALVVLPAWALYRELTGSGRVASLATLLLLLVPEYLFAVLRGSHERLDRAFLFITLWLLVRSLKMRADPARFGIHVGLLLITTYSLIATNALFGMSFVAALATALVASWFARFGPAVVREHASSTARLLGWISVAAGILVIVFILIIYPPIEESLRELSTIPGALLTLVTSGGAGINPYASVLGAWVSPSVYLLLSMADFLILGASALIWLWLGLSWLRGRSVASTNLWLLWLLFAAFAAQGAASIVSDRTGSFTGNVQLRAFSVFSTVATPLVAIVLARWRPGPWLRTVAVATVSLAVVSALLKITLDPVVSNKWFFYSPDELQGMQWADASQTGTDIWVGPDDRLTSAFELVVGNRNLSNQWDIAAVGLATRSFLVSDVIRLNSARLGATMPPLGSRNLVYDNGEAQVYRDRPLAPFDR